MVLTLPKFFFSAEFLSNLAPCSKDLLRAVSDARNWTNKTIFADDDEFQNPAALRQAERVWGLAEHVVLRVPQLACVSNWPESILLQWSGWPVVRPRQQSDQVHAWESQILLGSARFTLVAPVFTQVLYVGLQAPDSDRRIFCKLSLPFTSFMTVDFGLSGGFLARRASSLPGFRAGTQHDIVAQWDTRWFAVHLDEALLSHAILADDTQDAPPAQARLFIWAITSAIYSANAFDCAASAHLAGCWGCRHVLRLWTVGLNSIWLLGCVHLVPELGVPGARSSYSVAQMSYLRPASSRLLCRQDCGRLCRRLHSLDRDSASSARAGRTSSNTSCWSSFRIQR